MSTSLIPVPVYLILLACLPACLPILRVTVTTTLVWSPPWVEGPK
ncbi:hypothetical protein E2C01_083762 [Portunus trituberculatus]|uniref:Uncharacterized protein n=1 Tax=Portunus trituberculatus TaxID=210409 RepID=A0A5B7ITA8_PORTR|nr:hypothetical protein [Portunus trituberculatus]